MRALPLLLVAVFHVACQPPVISEPDAATPLPDAGVEPVDAGPRCGDFAHEADGGCVTNIIWTRGTKGPSGRDHHGTWLQSGTVETLFVFGGIDMAAGAAKMDAWSARIGENGLPETWQPAPRPLFWQTGMGLDGLGTRIYAVSGISASAGQPTTTTPRVQSIAFNADGSLGTWREEKSLPGEGRFHITATRVGNWLFAMGGRLADGKAMPTIWKANIGADGVLSDWTEDRAFPQPRTHHASFAIGNRLYLSGGFDALTFTEDPTHHRNILTATVDPTTGALSEWTTLPLPWDLSTHSAAVMDGYVYLVGGFDGALNLLAKVRRAKVNDDGTLGAFEELDAMLFARAHVHHSPMANGRIFSVGGNVGGHVVTDDVLVGYLH
jgi:hypothetical protein